jgi:hypothetical protein
MLGDLDLYRNFVLLTVKALGSYEKRSSSDDDDDTREIRVDLSEVAPALVYFILYACVLKKAIPVSCRVCIFLDLAVVTVLLLYSSNIES